MRRWFKAPVTSIVWDQGPLLSFLWHSYTKYCFLYFEHLHMVFFSIPCYWSHNIQGGWPICLTRLFKAPVTSVARPNPELLLTFLYKVLFSLFWTPAHGIYYHNPCYWPHNIQAGWLSGVRRWFKASVTSVTWVWVPLLSICWHSWREYCFFYFENLHMSSSTIIHAIDHKTYRQDGLVV